MKFKIIVGVAVAVIAALAFTEYNEDTNSTTLSRQQRALVDSLEPKIAKLQVKNEKLKLDIANFIKLQETAGLHTTQFNNSSETLLDSASAVQVEIDALRSFLDESKLAMSDGEMQDAWNVVIEVFDFRREHNQKLIELAKIGTTLDLDNDIALSKFESVAIELETIESRLPEMQKKLIAAFTAFDLDVGKQAERRLKK